MTEEKKQSIIEAAQPTIDRIQGRTRQKLSIPVFNPPNYPGEFEVKFKYTKKNGWTAEQVKEFE